MRWQLVAIAIAVDIMSEESRYLFCVNLSGKKTDRIATTKVRLCLIAVDALILFTSFRPVYTVCSSQTTSRIFYILVVKWYTSELENKYVRCSDYFCKLNIYLLYFA